MTCGAVSHLELFTLIPTAGQKTAPKTRPPSRYHWIQNSCSNNKSKI